MPIVSLVVDGVNRHSMQVVRQFGAYWAVVARVAGSPRIISVGRHDRALATARMLQRDHPNDRVLVRRAIADTVCIFASDFDASQHEAANG